MTFMVFAFALSVTRCGLCFHYKSRKNTGTVSPDMRLPEKKLVPCRLPAQQSFRPAKNKIPNKPLTVAIRLFYHGKPHLFAVAVLIYHAQKMPARRRDKSHLVMVACGPEITVVQIPVQGGLRVLQ